jgi:CHAT domain-containing protein
VALSPTAYGAGNDRRIDSLPPLPMSRVEAERLASLVQPRATTLLGFDAVPAKFERLSAQPFSIIHIATHTLLDDRYPDLSGLVLSMLDRNGRRTDGFLPLLDIYNLHLDTSLVVLSACDTYIGSDLRGEGFLGLARGFLYAGARQVLASLWKVDDRATAAFMERFYTALLRDKVSAPAALKTAQNGMSNDPAWRSPRYWAGFVLEGDPQ